MSRWIQTYTGLHFPLNPVDPAKVCVEDIAHALSLLCRFGGHCRKFYSVAQHCVNVSRICAPRHHRHGLMHDATEAYCQDLVHDVKGEVGEAYKTLEKRIHDGINVRFGLVWDQAAEDDVHLADLTMLATEARDLLGQCETPWTMTLPPPIAGWTVDPLDPEDAKELFLKRYEELARG